MERIEERVAVIAFTIQNLIITFIKQNIHPPRLHLHGDERVKARSWDTTKCSLQRSCSHSQGKVTTIYTYGSIV